MAKQIFTVFLKTAVFYLLLSAAAFFSMLIPLPGNTEAIRAMLVLVIGNAVFQWLRRKHITDAHRMAHGIYLAIVMAGLALSMLIAKGEIETVMLSPFLAVAFPFLPVLFFSLLMSGGTWLWAGAAIVLVSSWLFSVMITKKTKLSAIVCAIAAVCVPITAISYANRPSEKYNGHGFAYMNGYSSTDFTGYHVYDGEKLVTLDHAPEFQITDIKDMPVLDGAEACYPVYAAVAKALYKDIDVIEKEAQEAGNRRWQVNNGRIVTFTNTVVAYNRLLEHEVDIVIGARPSEEQIGEAKLENEEFVITPIGREAFVFFVEEDNPVDSLTSEQIRAIYHGDITNWKEVGGKDQEIIAFQRPANSGSQVMMQVFMGDVSLKEPMTYEKVDAMSGVISHVAQYNNEKGALGYTFRYFLVGLNQEKHVKILSVDGVYPTEQTIADGTYPVIGAMVAATLASNKNENVQKVIDFLLSEDGQEIIEKTGYGRIR